MSRERMEKKDEGRAGEGDGNHHANRNTRNRLRDLRSSERDGVPVRARRGSGAVPAPAVNGPVSGYLERVDPKKRLKELERIVEDFSPAERKRYEELLDRAMSPQEIMALPDLPVTELLGPLVVKGNRIMLGATKGHGKTSMALQMVNAILFGEEFLGFIGIGDTRALIIDAEQKQRTIKRRIAEAGLEDVPRDTMMYYRVPEGLSLDKDAAEQAAIETLLAKGAYDIVVFDPLYMLGIGDTKDDLDANRLMKILDEWRRKYDFALLMPAHTRKTGADRYRFTMNDFFGSTALLRNAEVVLGLEKKHYGQARLHCFADRDGDLLEMFRDDVWELHFDRDEGFERGSKPDARKARTRDSLRKLERTIKEHPRSDVYELAELTGFARETVDKLVKQLKPARERVAKRYVYWLDGPGPTSS
jgi:hypothetical protein